ncbi:DUF4238 domain-containing protein [Sphingosinithalassobacter tenebrarum]|uniref:DUF4238 domain-containing protein n=2 Tax=Stakelama tenebrarum TaxID=2711215 RepID=A0A6G6Y8J7_9SPHN|nr:DUF4238 domain-containing protein [Sphingosinithalassobacter tenebrarum]
MTSWSIFIRSLVHRTPVGLRAFMSSGLDQWEETVDSVKSRYDDLKREVDPASFEDFIALYDKDKIDSAILRAIPGVLTSVRVGEVLNNLPMKIFRTSESVPEFLISDAVLIMTNGILVEGGHYAIPISPRCLLVAASQQQTLDEISKYTERNLVSNVNRAIVERATSFVGCTNRRQERFIRNRFGMRLKLP